MISRLAVAIEAGRDGFGLARWLRARGIEAYVIHTRIAVSMLLPYLFHQTADLKNTSRRAQLASDSAAVRNSCKILSELTR
jgi:hypothetical protein